MSPPHSPARGPQDQTRATMGSGKQAAWTPGGTPGVTAPSQHLPSEFPKSAHPTSPHGEHVGPSLRVRARASKGKDGALKNRKDNAASPPQRS